MGAAGDTIKEVQHEQIPKMGKQIPSPKREMWFSEFPMEISIYSDIYPRWISGSDGS
jgi:hypothetical protein